ncbi:unnamed protein product [Dovyalis caffra]|uniref:DUF7722 domain-containing protein n=1 Tax=Dovyalis caffra TaxID=77055 RepID=A0AAV1QR74_9ROSI|nr:unnamed protein product [Dovyalis caffra]
MEVSTEEAETKDFKSCKCGEFEKWIVELELEIEKRKSEYQELEAKFKELGEAKNGLENEVKGLRAKNGKVKEANGVVHLTVQEEEDQVMQLMIENKVLECEKKTAEREVEVWKQKYKELELYVSKLDDCVVSKGGERELNQVIRGKDGADPTCNTPGTPFTDIMCNHTVGGKLGIYLDSEGKSGRQVRKNLSFEEGESPSKKMAPSTPGYVRPVGPNVINICDSDDESDISGIQMVTPDDQVNGKGNVMFHSLEGTPDSENQKIAEIILKGAVCSQICEEDMDACNNNVPRVSTPKRKRAANIVASDTESDEDDNVPISKLKKMHLQESIPHEASFDSVSLMSDDFKGPVTRSRQRLATLRQHERKVKARSSSTKTSATNYQRGIPTTDDVEDSEESDDTGSHSEGESLDGFIVNDTHVSDADDTSSQSEEKSDGGNDAFSQPEDEGDDGSSLSGDESDGDTDLGKILSRFQRSKDHKFKWEFEGDMLADFGKDPELCMKAVCALYRQQTAEEKISKETLHDNGRGFSKFDAQRGSKLAEFLIDGDPSGDLKKSVQELQEHNSNGVKLCQKLATHYSKQLFQIYKNKEDPLFLPRDQENVLDSISPSEHMQGDFPFSGLRIMVPAHHVTDRWLKELEKDNVLGVLTLKLGMVLLEQDALDQENAIQLDSKFYLVNAALVCSQNHVTLMNSPTKGHLHSSLSAEERESMESVTFWAGGRVKEQQEKCGGFQMPLHYPRYSRSEYETMPEWQLDRLLTEYGLPVVGSVEQKRKFSIGAFLWPR